MGGWTGAGQLICFLSAYAIDIAGFRWHVPKSYLNRPPGLILLRLRCYFLVFGEKSEEFSTGAKKNII